MKKTLIIVAVIIICVMAVFTYRIYSDGINRDKSEAQVLVPSVKEETPSTVKDDDKAEPEKQEVKKDYDEVKMSVVGDILVHDDQLQSQIDPSTGQYDFKNNFKYVKDYIEKADIAVANFETVLAGMTKKYTGYPTFNSPDAIADALKYVGFDVLTTANNHILDCGLQGMLRTNNVLKEKGFKVLGTRENTNDKSYFIMNVNNIKLGMVNYVFESSRAGNKKSINSVPMPSGAEKLLDTFYYGAIDKDIEGMKTRVKELREQGADMIIFYMHWGEEYQTTQNANQKKIAQKLADIGVDVIIGGHPHVLQPLDVLKGKEGNKTLVAYSTGNFLSNQCYEKLQKREPEDGMILNLSFKKDKLSGKVSISEVTYIPTWVHRIPTGNLFTYEIVPVADAMENKQKYGLGEGDSIWRAENSLKHTDSIIAASGDINSTVPVFKYEDANKNP